jgi:mRNA-degrading endonuclease YafQ of YafQ-DinJ toxin-antitoxin module
MRLQEISRPRAAAQLIAETHQRNRWSRGYSAAEILGEAQSPVPQANETVFRRSELYKRTKTERVDPYPPIRRKFREFMQTKRDNPNQQFGNNDKPFQARGYFGTRVPGLRHAHITHDLSVVYRVQGNQIDLYGFFTHDDLGTGTPANLRRQQGAASGFGSLRFA